MSAERQGFGRRGFGRTVRHAAAAVACVLTSGTIAVVAYPAAQELGRAPASRPPWERIDRPSAEACGECHERVLHEWSQSLHHHAWTNANVRAATQDFAKEQCRACHSPMPVLGRDPTAMPEFRDFNHDDGVHCLSCHGLEGGVAAARTVEGAPCRPRFDEQFVSAEFCYPCHQLTHQAYDEYYTSDAFAVGLRCADCHFPQRQDGPGRSHGPHGGLSEEFVKRSVHWSCRMEGDTVLVTLRNRTGHKLPGEIPSRALIVRVDREDAEALYVTLRRPGKTEDREDDRLLPDESRTLRFELDGMPLEQGHDSLEAVPAHSRGAGVRSGNLAA